MRRCFLRFAVVAVGKTHTVAAVEDPAPTPVADSTEPLPASSTATDLSTPSKRRRKHKVTIDHVPEDFVPSASEAPELLTSYVQPKPFVSPRRLQVFTVSMGVGMVAVGMVYFLVSRSIGDSIEQEQLGIDSVAANNARAVAELRRSVISFKAPSTYEELQQKVKQRDEEVERQEREVVGSTSVLYTETVFRLKMWWNRCLGRIQDAVDQFCVAHAQRQEHMARASVEATIRQHGYELVSLTVASAQGTASV